MESNVISKGRPFIFLIVTQQENRSVIHRWKSTRGEEQGGGERRLNAGSRGARRVNTARQSKDLPSSYYLIIGVILNRCKSHLQTEIVTSRRLGMLSNDLLGRADPLCARRWAGKDTLRVQDERLDPSTYSLLEGEEGEGEGKRRGRGRARMSS